MGKQTKRYQSISRSASASGTTSSGQKKGKKKRKDVTKNKSAEEEEELLPTASAMEFGEMDERIEAILKYHRRNTNIWETVCKDIEKELTELDLVLVKIGVPPHNFKKDKKFPFHEYVELPDLRTCFSKDFLDCFVFPQLIPAIQALIRFATKNRVFQCRYCTFNALDYIVEYIYNNNPNHPERALNPVPLFEIPFAKEWVRRFPRKPYPKWLTMSEEDACLTIQCAVRGWLVRRREPFRSMRQKWKNQKKEVKAKKDSARRPESAPLFSPYYSELTTADETVEDPPVQTPPPLLTHSDTCMVCNRFREFLRRQQELLLSQPLIRVPSGENDEFGIEAETLVFPRSLFLGSEETDE